MRTNSLREVRLESVSGKPTIALRDSAEDANRCAKNSTWPWSSLGSNASRKDPVGSGKDVVSIATLKHSLRWSVVAREACKVIRASCSI